MAEKLPRVTAKIFASNAAEDDIGQYGSALAGNKVLTSDISEIQALPAYEKGWRGAVLSTRNYPTLQEMNGLQKTFSQQICYLLETGLPEWDENTTYWANTSFCQFDGKIYQSLTDNNIGNNPTTDATNWQYINFNGANQDLSNLSGLGNDFINQSKALYTGQVSDNSIVYADVEKAYHSSFDISKFTLVGNPVITDDGIASGFGNSSKVYSNVNFTEGSIIKIKGGFYFTTITTLGHLFCIDSAVDVNIRLIQNVNGDLVVFSPNTGVRINKSVYNPQENDLIQYTVTVDTSKIANNIQLEVWCNGIMYKSDTGNYNGDISNITRIYWGSNKLANSSEPYNGEINLAYSAVKVNGFLVFAGNKTGLDVVKLDDYTVVGNPTITADGIASGFETTNFINIPVQDLSANDFIIEDKFVYKSSENVQNLFRCAINGYKGAFGFLVGISVQDKLYFSDGTGDKYYNTSLIEGETYSYKFVVNDTTWTLFLNNTQVLTGTWSKNIPTAYISLGGYAALDCFIDLNSFKIYIKEKLNYQACLKIPYALSFGGARIVDMQYLSRVKDAYEQGYTEYSYLTIDEENQKFTLPQGMSVYEGKGLFNALKVISPLTPLTTYQSRTYDSVNKSAEQYYGIIDFSDKNNVQTGRVDNWNISPTSIVTRMSVFNPVSNKRGDIYVFADDNGETYATAPTPASTLDKSTKVATTEWVQNYGKPNFSVGVTIPYNTDYTCPTNGWWFVGAKLSASSLNAIVSRVIAQGNINGQSVYLNSLEVNSNLATRISTDSHQLCRVYAGDVIKLYTESSSNDVSVASYVNIFYPDT